MVTSCLAWTFLQGRSRTPLYEDDLLQPLRSAVDLRVKALGALIMNNISNMITARLRTCSLYSHAVHKAPHFEEWIQTTMLESKSGLVLGSNTWTLKKGPLFLIENLNALVF